MSSKPSARKSFASQIQLVLIFLLVLSLVMMGQQFSKQIYQAGLLLLVVSTLLQIGASNVPSHAGAPRTLRIMATALVIVGIVFGLSIKLAPYLIQLGRG